MSTQDHYYSITSEVPAGYHYELNQGNVLLAQVPGAAPLNVYVNGASREFYDLQAASLPVGVSVLCPGWVRTAFADAERNWPAGRGEPPLTAAGLAAMAAPQTG